MDEAELRFHRDCDYQHNCDWRLESHKSVISFAHQAIKSAFLLNAGAMLAVLTFLGTRGEANVGRVAILASWPMMFFILGVILATLSAGGSYFSQSLFTHADEENSYRKIGSRLQIATYRRLFVSAFTVSSSRTGPRAARQRT